MFHQHQSRQVIHQIVEADGRKGNGADETEEDAHGRQEPLIQHDACKQERRNDGTFLLVQVFGRCFPDRFDIYIYLFIKINEDAVYFLMAFQ